MIQYTTILLLVLHYLYKYGINKVCSIIIQNIPFAIVFTIIQRLLYKLYVSSRPSIENVTIDTEKGTKSLEGIIDTIKYNALHTNLTTLLLYPVCYMVMGTNDSLIPLLAINYAVTLFNNYSYHYIYYHMYTPIVLYTCMDSTLNGNVGSLMMVGYTLYDTYTEHDKDGSIIKLFEQPMYYSILLSQNLSDTAYLIIASIMCFTCYYEYYLEHKTNNVPHKLRDIMEQHYAFVQNMNIPYGDNEYIKKIAFYPFYILCRITESFIVGKRKELLYGILNIVLTLVPIFTIDDMYIIVWFVMWLITNAYLLYINNEHYVKSMIKNIDI
jgi:uncharacterized short protein YbdD (DUF466 family)